MKGSQEDRLFEKMWEQVGIVVSCIIMAVVGCQQKTRLAPNKRIAFGAPPTTETINTHPLITQMYGIYSDKSTVSHFYLCAHKSGKGRQKHILSLTKVISPFITHRYEDM